MEGLGSADQAEVVVNRVAVYNNIAAVHLEQKVRGSGCVTGDCLEHQRLPRAPDAAATRGPLPGSWTAPRRSQPHLVPSAHRRAPCPLLQDYGLAVDFCDKALALDPGNARARLRRAKANVARHRYDLAEADLDDADRAGGGWPAPGVEEVRAALTRARKEGAVSERSSFGRMFAQKA